jgi:hypothetical protein
MNQRAALPARQSKRSANSLPPCRSGVERQIFASPGLAPLPDFFKQPASLKPQAPVWSI